MATEPDQPPSPGTEPSGADRAKAAAEQLVADAAATATAEAARRTAETMARGAMAAVGKAAGSALDAVEKMLFGKLGGAEEAVKRESHADPIDRLRAEYGLDPQAKGSSPADPDTGSRRPRQPENLGAPSAPAAPARPADNRTARERARDEAEAKARKELQALKRARDARTGGTAAGIMAAPVVRTLDGAGDARKPVGGSTGGSSEAGKSGTAGSPGPANLPTPPPEGVEKKRTL